MAAQTLFGTIVLSLTAFSAGAALVDVTPTDEARPALIESVRPGQDPTDS